MIRKKENNKLKSNKETKLITQNKLNKLNKMNNKNKLNKRGVEMTMSNVIGLAIIFILIIAIIAFLLQGESSIGKLIKQIFG